MNPFYKLIENLYLRIPNNLVYFDQMTKLHNRYYYDRVVKVKYNGVECVVVFVDINNLKKVNDIEGHVEGSKLIEYVGEILSTSKANDICRTGGDEFVMVYTPDRFVQENFDWLTENKKIMSYGVYEKEPYEDMSSAVKKADKRMYEMKKKFHESENNT